jgi:hypothetical protein
MSIKQEKLLFWLLIGTGSFNIVDYVLTLDFIERGFEEANPIMVSMIGTYEFPLIKLLFVPLLLLALWQNKDKLGDLVFKLSWIPFISYFFLMIYYRLLLTG